MSNYLESKLDLAFRNNDECKLFYDLLKKKKCLCEMIMPIDNIRGRPDHPHKWGTRRGMLGKGGGGYPKFKKKHGDMVLFEFETANTPIGHYLLMKTIKNWKLTHLNYKWYDFGAREFGWVDYWDGTLDEDEEAWYYGGKPGNYVSQVLDLPRTTEFNLNEYMAEHGIEEAWDHFMRQKKRWIDPDIGALS